MGKGAAFIVGGGFIADAGLLAIVAAFARSSLLLFGLPPWAATFVGGLLVARIAHPWLIPYWSAASSRRTGPPKTIETLKEDAQWLKAQTK